MANIRISGNTEKLERLIKSIESLHHVASKAAEKTAPVVEQLIEKEFLSTKSPYGDRWAALKRPTGLPPIRGLKDYFHVVSHNNVVHVGNEKFYAKFHQTGTRFMPARKFLPDGQLSTAWRKKIVPEINKLVLNILKGGSYAV